MVLKFKNDISINILYTTIYMRYVIYMRYLGAGDLGHSMLAMKTRGPESEPKHLSENASIRVHAYNPCDWETGTRKILGSLATQPSLSVTSRCIEILCL